MAIYDSHGQAATGDRVSTLALLVPTDPTAETPMRYASTPASTELMACMLRWKVRFRFCSGRDVYQHFRPRVFQVGSGEAGIEAVKRRCRSCMASVDTFLTLTRSDTHISDGNIIHAGGPNGGACVVTRHRGRDVADAVVIRDIYTQASKAETVLTFVLLWDCLRGWFSTGRLLALKRFR